MSRCLGFNLFVRVTGWVCRISFDRVWIPMGMDMDTDIVMEDMGPLEF